MTDGATAVRTPAERGFRLPADTAPHERVLLAWPTMARRDFWRGHLGAARDAFAIVARAMAAYEPVTIVADRGEGRAAEGWVGDGIEVIEVPLDDSWIRDNGPVILTNGTERLAVGFDFNGWGEKLLPFDKDAAVPAAVAVHLGIEHVRAPFVLEGGAFTTDGEGTLITTESCLLNPNRNGATTKDEMEQRLRDWLGVDTVVWLACGLADDWGTDGHADNVVAFAGPGRVLLQTTTDASDPDWHTAIDNRRRLTDAGFEVVEVDVLPHVECYDQTVEVPYLNFYVGNDAVFVPIAGAAADREMVDLIGSCFPGRAAVGVPGSVLAYGGGGIHCITQPVPAVDALRSSDS